MGTKSPGSGVQRYRLILRQCLAIQLSKPGHTPEDFWMYDSGYMIFQNFLAANAQCWWNGPLTAATQAVKYAGHIAPGILLITGEPCALEVLRGAYARSVLKAPATFVISSLGEIEDCVISPIVQGQFTPLHEALCDVIMDLTTEGHSATIENIRGHLGIRFAHMTTPSIEVVYDTLAQLMQEQKIYQTAKGYFILTPERRRSRSRPRSQHGVFQESNELNDYCPHESRTILMTNTEALRSLYGEISTERDGDVTHQCIQTNLADVKCGGNPNDKILYPRTSKRRSSSFPTPRSLERRHSLRFFGSSKRLQRCSSTRSLSKAYAQTLNNTDSSSSEYQSTDSSSPKKGSLLSRLFRRSGRNKSRQLETYSGQFPPPEWFNSKAVHLHSVGTQTTDHEMPHIHTLSNSTFYDGSELSQRSITLPRRHHRRHLSSESTFLISSRDCSPIRRRSPEYSCSSLSRSTHSVPVVNATNTIANSSSTRLNSPHKLYATQKTSHLTGRGYSEPSPLRTAKSQKTMFNLGNKYQDNKCEYRSNAPSGPSSLESGKYSNITSGPSSIESSKTSYNKTSGHSSLESQRSNGSSLFQPNKQARSIIMLNSSPRGTPRHQLMKARAEQQTLCNNNQIKTGGGQTNVKQATPTTSYETTSSTIHTPNTSLYTQDSSQNNVKTSGAIIGNNNTSTTSISNSTSNNSITLKVTTSNGNDGGINNYLPNTKIVVENTPVQSVITFENGQLTDQSKVYIINNETTTNEKGEILKKTLSKQHKLPTNNELTIVAVTAATTTSAKTTTTTTTTKAVITTTPATMAMTNTIKSTVMKAASVSTEQHKKQDNICRSNNPNNKTKKNICNNSYNNCDGSSISLKKPGENMPRISSTTFRRNQTLLATKNNNQLLYGVGLDQSPNLATNSSGHLVYKNNVLYNDGYGSHNEPFIMLKSDAKETTGSMGNLWQLEKNSKDALIKANNSNIELNNIRILESAILPINASTMATPVTATTKAKNNLNSNVSFSSNNLLNILRKKSISMGIGSEPNLAQKDNNCSMMMATNEMKSIQKDTLYRRFSMAKESTTSNIDINDVHVNNTDELYNFPSLTDLSFNFTSLAAQKILQGVSLNSIDTLVELNIAAAAAAAAALEKPQNNQITVGATTATEATPKAITSGAQICTDYGVV